MVPDIAFHIARIIFDIGRYAFVVFLPPPSHNLSWVSMVCIFETDGYSGKDLVGSAVEVVLVG